MSEKNPPHPAWPSYFDIDVLVYLEDWDITESHLRLGLSAPGGPMSVIIDSVTRLPDDLVFIRGRYGANEALEEEAETYYGIASWEQYEDRRLGYGPGRS